MCLYLCDAYLLLKGQLMMQFLHLLSSGLETPVIHHLFSHFGELSSFFSFRLKASSRFQFSEGSSLFLSHSFSLLGYLLLCSYLGLCLNSSLLFSLSLSFYCSFFSGLGLSSSLCFSLGF